MLNFIQNITKKYFSDPEAVVLFFLMIAAILIVIFLGGMLTPFFAALIIAYLLEGLVVRLEKYHLPHWLAVMIVYLLFTGIVAFSLFLILPLLWQQSVAFITELPSMVNHTQTLLLTLPQKYPDIFTTEQVNQVLTQIRMEFTHLGQRLFSLSLSSIPNIIEMIVYFILVPLMVYFMLMDRDKLVALFTKILPENRRLLVQIWDEVNQQFGNFVRGKVLEISIVAIISYIGFVILHLDYAILLAVLCGFSVLIPFIGVTIVTIPVEIVAYTQFGWSSEFAYVSIFYAIIMVLDGNVLVPLLFSEAVNLHPLMILLAVLLFGGIWGFWGVFFAIPLATVVKAIYNAWPKEIP
jgi:putative permease